MNTAAVNPNTAGSPAARRTAADRQPKYLRIHAELRDRITSGQWPAGPCRPSGTWPPSSGSAS